MGCPVLGLWLHWHGQNQDVEQTLEEAVRIATADGNHVAAMHASGGLGAIECERGELIRAEARARRGVRPRHLAAAAHAQRARQTACAASSDRSQQSGDALSEAELSVLRLLRSQLSQREIGGELHLSVNTVKTHSRNIYRKLAVATRAEAVERARALSLI